MEEIKTRIIQFFIENWDTLAAVAVLGIGLLLTWLKKLAAEDGLAIIVTAVEGFTKAPPPVGKREPGMTEFKQRLIAEALGMLKRRVATVAESNRPAAKAIEKQVRFVDPK